MEKTATPNQLDELAFKLETAKAEEAKARAYRIAVEDEIIQMVGVKEEGSATMKSDFYKITTTGGITRTLDSRKWAEIHPLLPAAIANQVVRQKPELDIRQFKALKDLSPEQYAIVAQAVTSKPRKASVRIERLGESD